MGESVKKAEEIAAVLENTAWELFETVGQLPKGRAPRAQSTVARVKEALTRDEHVVELKSVLKEAQSAALELLTGMVEVTPPPPPPLPPPVVTPIPPRAEMTGDQHGIDGQGATTVFETIKRAMESDADLILDINWRLYRRGNQ